MDDIIISHHDHFSELRQKLRQGGLEKLHIISDFDRTLTTNFIKGRKAPSLIASLRDGKFLSPDYPAAAQALYDYYAPLEMDLNLDKQTKNNLIAEWYRRHFELLIKSGLNQESLITAIEHSLANLRPLVPEFLSLLKDFNIPLLIFSASGLGISALKYFFHKRGLLSENIHFIANDFIWSEAGQAIGVKEPIIHSGNKDESMIADFNLHDLIKKRPNVILLGDSLDDANMATASPSRTILKLAFLNDRIREQLPAYKSHYDAIILNDGNFQLVLDILQDIINQKNN